MRRFTHMLMIFIGVAMLWLGMVICTYERLGGLVMIVTALLTIVIGMKPDVLLPRVTEKNVWLENMKQTVKDLKVAIDTDVLKNVYSFGVSEWYPFSASDMERGRDTVICDVPATEANRAQLYAMIGQISRQYYETFVLQETSDDFKEELASAQERAHMLEIQNEALADQLQQIKHRDAELRDEIKSLKWDVERKQQTIKALNALLEDGVSVTLDNTPQEQGAPIIDGLRTVPKSCLERCDTCASQEGTHYCLLHTQTLKNMDITVCDSWAPKEGLPFESKQESRCEVCDAVLYRMKSEVSGKPDLWVCPKCQVYVEVKED